MGSASKIAVLVLTFHVVRAPAYGTEVWNGQWTTFTKTDYADWTQSANQDAITPSAKLTPGIVMSPYSQHLEATNGVAPSGEHESTVDQLVADRRSGDRRSSDKFHHSDTGRR